MIIQLVDPNDALRIDVFRPRGAALGRSQNVQCEMGQVSVMSVADLAARTASLLLGLERGATVPSKHADDFLRLIRTISLDGAENVWPGYRKEGDADTFEEAARRIRSLVQSRKDLLVPVVYSQDVDGFCPNCIEVGPFRLSPAERVMAILGYC
ncbi:MAG: hypothetical protein WA876_00470 [Candidatus Acidiferrales bacterium]